MIKRLLLAFSVFAQDSSLELIKATIRIEVSRLIFRFLAGLVLASIVLFSLVQLGSVLHIYLSKFENGLLTETLSFGFLAVVCSITLYFLLDQGQVKSDLKDKELPAPPNAVNLEILVIRFAEGIIAGLESKREISTQTVHSHGNSEIHSVDHSKQKDKVA